MGWIWRDFCFILQMIPVFIPPWTKFRGYVEITLSVRRSVRLSASVSFDIGIPYLAHRSITMRGCVKYIHDPDTTLNFDLKIKFLGFMTWLCVQASVFFFYLWHSHTLLGTWVYHHGTMSRTFMNHDLDLWPICGCRGGGYPLWVFAQSFLSTQVSWW